MNAIRRGSRQSHSGNDLGLAQEIALSAGQRTAPHARQDRLKSMVSGRTSASDDMMERIAVWAVQMRLPMHALTPEAQSLQ